jgi:hypothetical protein
MRFMAMFSVSCASGPRAPRLMPGVTNRLRISVMLSTSSSGIGRAVAAPVEQVAQLDRRQGAHPSEKRL